MPLNQTIMTVSVYQVAMMSVLLALRMWSLGPTGPPLRAAAYVSRAGAGSFSVLWHPFSITLVWKFCKAMENYTTTAP